MFTKINKKACPHLNRSMPHSAKSRVTEVSVLFQYSHTLWMFVGSRKAEEFIDQLLERNNKRRGLPTGGSRKHS